MTRVRHRRAVTTARQRRAVTTARQRRAACVVLGVWRCSLALLAVCAGAVTLTVAPAALGRPASASSVVVHRCARDATRLTVTSGIPSMGRFGEVISAANESSAPCSLGGYPSVSAPRVGAPGAVVAVDSSSDATGVPAAEAPRPVQLDLRPGQVASAVLGGPDRTPDGGPGCRTFHGYDVGLPGSSEATAVHAELADCDGLFVGPFVLGFDGTAPSGEVAGTAPACPEAASPAPGSAPAVQIEAWRGSTLAGSTTVFGSRSPAPYHLVLSPGRYRISSAHQPSRRITVQAGRRDDLGRYGGCAAVGPTPTTIGASGQPPATTSTTDRPS